MTTIPMCPGCANPVSEMERLTGVCAKDGQPIDRPRVEVTLTLPTWEFEAADPEVGFLSDSVTHTCEANVDAEPAEQAEVNHWALPDGKTLREQIVWACPACRATTTSVDDFPRWMFEV